MPLMGGGLKAPTKSLEEMNIESNSSSGGSSGFGKYKPKYAKFATWKGLHKKRGSWYKFSTSSYPSASTHLIASTAQKAQMDGVKAETKEPKVSFRS